MTKETLREFYLMTEKELNLAISYLYDLKLKQEHCEERIKKYKRWILESQDVICKSCIGKGKINHIYAQDDIKPQTCETCHGSGLNG